MAPWTAAVRSGLMCLHAHSALRPRRLTFASICLLPTSHALFACLPACLPAVHCSPPKTHPTKTIQTANLWDRIRIHMWRTLLRGPFTSLTHMWTSTEVYNAWMRALGAKIGRQCWLSEFFRCSEFEMYEVGDTASVCR